MFSVVYFNSNVTIIALIHKDILTISSKYIFLQCVIWAEECITMMKFYLPGAPALFLALLHVVFFLKYVKKRNATKL